MDLELKRSPMLAVFSRSGAASRKGAGAANGPIPRVPRTRPRRPADTAEDRCAPGADVAHGSRLRTGASRWADGAANGGSDQGIPTPGGSGGRRQVVVLTSSPRCKAEGRGDRRQRCGEHSARSTTEGAAGLSVRLGRFALTGNPVVRFRDEVITPNVEDRFSH